MDQNGIQRKLAAIFYADVVGYSRLTGIDEEGTHRALSASLDVIAAAVEGRGGRIIHYAGDAVLAEFDSVVVALESAVQIQRELAERNRDIAEERRLRYRVGINLGDIIVDRGDIYGDGVNVAARLESLADPGGICVSAKVRDEVGNKLDLEFEDMGDQRVKNIAEPVRAFKVPLDADTTAVNASAKGRKPPSRRWALASASVIVLAVAAALLWFKPWAPALQTASIESMAFPLPDKPSIAVLPFDNLSSDPDQDYLADGITEDIITALSNAGRLFVIARNSTFVYKGKPVKVQQVAEELGVRYVLEGSVQKSANKVRITAQLIDALTGNHLWAERFDREMTGLFALQDEITKQIVIAMRIKLTEGEEVRVYDKHTRNIQAWDLLTKGMQQYHRSNKTANANARVLFEEAIEVDPDYALAHALLGWTHWQDAYQGWSGNRKQSMLKASGLAEKAGDLDGDLPDVYALRGVIHLAKGHLEKAAQAGEKAVAQSPNHATNTALLGMIYQYSGRPVDAIRKIKQAMRLSPYYPGWYLEVLGFSYLSTKQPDKALIAFGEFSERDPSANHAAHAFVGRALAYHALKRDEDGRAEIAKALEADPTISLLQLKRLTLSVKPAEVEDMFTTLKRFGLPE